MNLMFDKYFFASTNHTLIIHFAKIIYKDKQLKEFQFLYE